MNNKNYIAVLLLLALLSVPAAAFAEDHAPASVTNVQSAAEAGDRDHPLPYPAIDLVPGKDGGSIRFVINGRSVGWFDAHGLHVIGDIEYGASLTDAGPEALRDVVRKMGGYDE